MAHRLEPSIVRIYSANDLVVGTGFLITDKYILTCAHVVAEALGISHDTKIQPAHTLNLDFPFFDHAPKSKGMVKAWYPCKNLKGLPTQLPEDIAILELSDSLPEGAYPVHLLSLNNKVTGRKHICSSCGFPGDEPDGKWTNNLECLGSVAGGCLQIRGTSELGFFVSDGYSGSCLWDEDLQGVTGIVVAREANEDPRVAYVIPIEKIEKLLASLGVRVFPAGSIPRPIPFVICAMTLDEAEGLFSKSVFSDSKTNALLQKYLELEKRVDDNKNPQIELLNCYATKREDWCPPILNEKSIKATIEEVFSIYYRQSLQEDDEFPYPISISEEFFSNSSDRKYTRALRERGCIFIVDPISMLHPMIYESFVAQHFDDTNEKISVLAISPISLIQTDLHKFLEKELQKEIQDGFEYFENDLLNSFEFKTSDGRHIRRWLNSMIPQAANAMAVTMGNRPGKPTNIYSKIWGTQ